ncbi:hypothetical protein C8Q77DRAFT_461575 [Trametes polyzona]|nr:hypothetical protein C8Q77DRAFT_461575 [Trametes polyzona]
MVRPTQHRLRPSQAAGEERGCRTIRERMELRIHASGRALASYELHQITPSTEHRVPSTESPDTRHKTQEAAQKQRTARLNTHAYQPLTSIAAKVRGTQPPPPSHRRPASRPDSREKRAASKTRNSARSVTFSKSLISSHSLNPGMSRIAHRNAYSQAESHADTTARVGDEVFIVVEERKGVGNALCPDFSGRCRMQQAPPGYLESR